MKETRGIIILLYYTENATLKQTLNGPFLTAQRLASSVRELTGTLQSPPFNRTGTSWVYEPPIGEHLSCYFAQGEDEDLIAHVLLIFY